MPPADFRDFWLETLNEIGDGPPEAKVAEGRYSPSGYLDHRFDVSWSGLGGVQVGGWLFRPMTSRGRSPAVVYYPGYGGQVWDRGDLSRRGYVAFACSPRGGLLSDPDYKASISSMLCEGIETPQTYSFRGVYADAIQAVRFVHSLPEVDSHRVYVCGASGGAACAAAAAAFAEGVAGLAAEIPFMTDFPCVLEQVDTAPYSEVVQYVRDHPGMADTIRTTLSYFDTVSFAPEIGVPTIVSYGEDDRVCPPATVRTFFDALRCVKALAVYPSRGHSRGADFLELSLAFFQSHA